MMFEQDLIREKKQAALEKAISVGFQQIDSGYHSDVNVMDLFEQTLNHVEQK